MDELDNIEPSNSLILCRNFWSYLDDDKIELLIEKLSKIETSSRIITGNFDKGIIFKEYNDKRFNEQFPRYFKRSKCKCGYIFQKREN